MESEITKIKIFMKKRNPGSLFPFEKRGETKEELIEKTTLLLEIKTMPS